MSEHSIDETHCLVHVGWSSEFEKDGRRIDVPFTNAYLLEQNDGLLKFSAGLRVMKSNCSRTMASCEACPDGSASASLH
ncbi:MULTISPECIES: hypothetical protein [Bradyrhizobium]|uniref:Uncharacterized protein n=1 Tax=Bradyrhizobium frederickii TaxID=2560054 RepID=A0A4Y9LJL9_9BRAD|nr:MULTISPECIES: hypothetical protein [Bradyrhizobium]RTE91740.1 hypothetical protein D6B98_20275 [Bradyrhizobium sp. LVM 105]TFV41942.1 hypothetical protein E4K66_06465 [Bradyrhizobium frederickii]